MFERLTIALQSGLTLLELLQTKGQVALLFHNFFAGAIGQFHCLLSLGLLRLGITHRVLGLERKAVHFLLLLLDLLLQHVELRFHAQLLLVQLLHLLGLALHLRRCHGHLLIDLGEET